MLREGIKWERHKVNCLVNICSSQLIKEHSHLLLVLGMQPGVEDNETYLNTSLDPRRFRREC